MLGNALTGRRFGPCPTTGLFPWVFPHQRRETWGKKGSVKRDVTTEPCKAAPHLPFNVLIPAAGGGGKGAHNVPTCSDRDVALHKAFHACPGIRGVTDNSPLLEKPVI